MKQFHELHLASIEPEQTEEVKSLNAPQHAHPPMQHIKRLQQPRRRPQRDDIEHVEPGCYSVCLRLLFDPSTMANSPKETSGRGSSRNTPRGGGVKPTS